MENYSSVDSSDDSSNDSTDNNSHQENNNRIKIDYEVKTFQLRSFYDQYLKTNKINLCPEYQRDFCWNESKQNLFIDTIMKNYIVPMFIIIKKDKNEHGYDYECIDGQHRFTVIKNYIEGIKISDNYTHIHWRKSSKSKIYYEKNKEIDSIKYNYKKYMSSDQIDTFNDFNITVCIIKTKLSFEDITKIFFRLQNGEPVKSSTIILNYEHPICKLMRKHNFGRIDTYESGWGLQLKNLIFKSKNKTKTAIIQICINTFLILLRDAINYDFGSTYLPINIIKKIEHNKLELSDYSCKQKIAKGGKFKDYDDIYDNFERFINFLSENIKEGEEEFLELPFIYVLYYIYIHESKKIIKYILEKHFDKFNNLSKSDITCRNKLRENYNTIIKLYSKSKTVKSKTSKKAK